MEKISSDVIVQQLPPGWSYEQDFIVKEFKFKDFIGAFSFMTKVAFLAEKADHHPNWENVYNRVTIRLQTHDAGGVTAKDITLAQSIENL